MTRRILVPLLAFCLGACAPEDDSPLSGGGSSSGDGGGSTTDDTGEANPDAPVITDLTAEFYSPPNLPTVIEIYAYWEDVQGDVDGGSIAVAVEASNGVTLSDNIDIDGKYARLDDSIDGSPVTLWLSGEDGDPVDTSLSYEISVQLKDVAGNESAAASTSL